MASAPPIYAPGNQPQLTPVQAPDPAAFGGDVGASLQQLGAAGADYVRVDHQLKLESQQFAFQRASAEAQAANDQFAQTVKAQTPADGSGYTNAVVGHFDENMEAAAAGITDPRLRQQALAQIAQQRRDVALRAEAWQREQGANKIADDGQATTDTLAASLYQNPSVASLQLAGQQVERMYANTALLDAHQKTRAIDEAKEALFVNTFRGLNESGRYAEAADLLSSGQAADAAKQLPTLGRELRVSVDRQQAQQKTAFNLGKEQASAAATMISHRIDAGETPTDAEMAQVQQNAALYGLDEKVYDLGTARQRIALNKETQPWLPAQYSSEIDRLRALGPKASVEDQVRLHQLEKIAPERIGEVQKDPGAFLSSNGAPPPPMPDDLAQASPQQWRALAGWQQGAQAALKRPVALLTATQAQPLAEAIAHGSPNDQLAVMTTIRNAGGAAPTLLRQLAPGNQPFQIAARLSALPDPIVAAQLTRDALMGREAKKGTPGIFADPNKPLIPVRQQADALFNMTFGQQYADQPELKAGLLETTDNIYAARMARAGQSVWNPDVYRGAMHAAVGGYQNQQGAMIGGVTGYRGAPLVVPAGMAQAEATRRFSRATAADYLAASAVPGAHAVWDNGQPIGSADLRAAHPTPLPDGSYGFKVNNTWVRMQGRHEPFRVDVSKLNPK